jgi:GH24 family phage-related lysozyme (muramidase)
MDKAWIAVVCACAFVLHVMFQKPQHIVDQFSWVDNSTVALIEHFEGKRHKAYQDSEGNWTIGVGHLIKRQTRDLLYRELSEEEVMAILHQDLEKCSRALESSLNVGVTRLQINALLSLCHNIGPDNMIRSDVMKYLNQGNMHKAADSFMNWSNPKVLQKRRNIERAIFLAGA